MKSYIFSKVYFSFLPFLNTKIWSTNHLLQPNLSPSQRSLSPTKIPSRLPSSYIVSSTNGSHERCRFIKKNVSALRHSSPQIDIFMIMNQHLCCLTNWHELTSSRLHLHLTNFTSDDIRGFQSEREHRKGERDLAKEEDLLVWFWWPGKVRKKNKL